MGRALLVVAAVLAGMGSARADGRSKAELLESVKQRVTEAQRVPPEVRQRVIDNVERQHATPAGRGFAPYLRARERIGRGPLAPLTDLLRGALRLVPGRGRRGTARAIDHGPRIQQLLAGQRAKVQMATTGAELLSNLSTPMGRRDEPRTALAIPGQPSRERGRGAPPGRTTIRLEPRGSSSLAAKTVLRGKDGLPTIVIDADAPLLSLLRRTIVTRLGRYRPGEAKSPNGQYIWSESERGILWELPILLQQYVKLRDKAPEGQDRATWLGGTAYGKLIQAKAKAGESVTLDDFLRIGEVGPREMALLSQVALQDLGFEARYAEVKPGLEWGAKDEKVRWYRREYVSLIRQPIPEYKRKERTGGDGTWWEVYTNGDPDFIRSFNGKPAGEWFDVYSDGGLRVSKYTFWTDGGNDHLGPGTSPQFRHSGRTSYWRQAKPFDAQEHAPGPRYAERRPPPVRRVQISFVTDAGLPNDHLSAWGPIRGYGSTRSDRSFNEYAGTWEKVFGGQRGAAGGSKERWTNPGRDPKRMEHLRTLGLPYDATDADIKGAYRQLAQKHHPDHGGDEERFKAINEAYEALGGRKKPK